MKKALMNASLERAVFVLCSLYSPQLDWGLVRERHSTHLWQDSRDYHIGRALNRRCPPRFLLFILVPLVAKRGFLDFFSFLTSDKSNFYLGNTLFFYTITN